MESIKLTDDVIISIKGLIELFGGIDNTAIITGVSKASLKKYLDKKVEIISYNIWNEKLLPYMQPTLYTKIADRITLLKEELNDCEEEFSESLNDKYSEINRIEKSTIKDDLLEKIIDNPILSLNDNYINTDPFMDLNDLKDAINELSNNKEYSKNKLLFHMINFRNIYEKFRPMNITKNDVYFGTVKLIEGMYIVLFRYIGIEPLFLFSKVNYTYINTGNYSYEEIDWNTLLKDTEIIINSVILKIEEKAFDLLCKLKGRTPYYCQHIIYELIRRRIKEVDRTNINIDFENNKIIINDVIIEINNPWKIRYEIIKSFEKI
jgi:hypothetical protein